MPEGRQIPLSHIQCTMTKQTLQADNITAVTQEAKGQSVSEGVCGQAAVLEVHLLLQAFENELDAVIGELLIICSREHVKRLLAHATLLKQPPFCQFLEQLLHQRNGLLLAAFTEEDSCLVVKVNLAPFQVAGFSYSGSGAEQEQNQGIVPVSEEGLFPVLQLSVVGEHLLDMIIAVHLNDNVLFGVADFLWSVLLSGDEFALDQKVEEGFKHPQLAVLGDGVIVPLFLAMQQILLDGGRGYFLNIDDFLFNAEGVKFTGGSHIPLHRRRGHIVELFFLDKVLDRKFE